MSTTPTRAEKACAYDLDDTDIAWLDVLNGERAQAGQTAVTEPQLERVIEELEVRCWERIQTIVKNEEGLGIEYDENVICDVCRSVSEHFLSLSLYFVRKLSRFVKNRGFLDF